MAGFLKNKSFETVVDIGAGRAPYKKFVKCNKYIAIDKENRGAANDLILADINSGIPLPDESVDLIIMTEVLEHVKKPAEVIKDAYRILRKGGIIILTTPMTWPIHERPNDFFRYTQFGLEYLLKEAGFKEFKINASNGFFILFCS